MTLYTSFCFCSSSNTNLCFW